MNTRILTNTLAALATLAVSSSARADELDLTGVWNATSKSQESDRSFTWTFAKDGDTLTVSSKDNSSGDERKFDRVTVDGKAVAMEIDFERDGNSGVLKVATEMGEPGKLEGKWSIIGSEGTVYAEGVVTASKAAAFAYAGAWKSTSTLSDGEEVTADLRLKGANTALEGAFTTGEGTVVEIAKATADEKNVRFEFEVVIGGNSVRGVVEASPEGADKLAGVWVLKGEDGSEAAKGAWTAAREMTPSLAGEWNVSATTPDGGEHTSTLILALDGETYSGKVKSNEGDEKELNSVKIEGGHVVVTLTMERDGQSGTVTVNADRQDDGSLDGKWSLSDKDGVEVASEHEHWKASRP